MSEDDKKRPVVSPVVVYYDGDCPMCRAFVPLIDEPQQADSVKFENLRTTNLPEGIKYLDATEKIHVVTENGEILKGAKAVFKALETNNKFLWLVRIGRLPVISTIAEIVYAIIAKNRFLLFDPDRKSSRLLLAFALIILLGILFWTLIKL
jgi:predicted DCC family thiol-disulfide oxidoreductase YuxK